MTSSVGIAAQRAPWTVYSVVLLVHSIPAAISVQVQTMDELEMMQGSNISAAIPLSSATSSATVPCAPFNDDTCLHHLYWGSGYSCATATEWCHSWGKDMQRCCSLACGTAYLTEKACNEMVSAGTCAYPHSGSSACDTTGELSSPEGALGAASYPTPSPGLVQGGYGGAPAATPSPTELTLGGYSGGFGGYPVAAPAATPSPTEPPTLGGYPGGFGGYGGAPAATPSPTEPPTLGGYPGGFGGYPSAAPSATPSPNTPPTSEFPWGGYGPPLAGASTATFGAAAAAPMSATGAAAPVSATGDPHLRNVHGEEFDLMQPGKHVLIQIPRKPLMYSLLRVDADVKTLGRSCADMYFQELNITGAWADVERSGGFHYYAQSGNDRASHWMHFGSVQLKVAHGRTREGTRYLNFYVRDLARAGFDVGGLLGGDDHTEASMPPEECAHRLAL